MTWKYFKLEEFACKCCGENKISSVLIDKLDTLRATVCFPLIVTSGYRCPAHNASISYTGEDGPHTTGLAVDLRVDRKQAYDLLKVALELGFTGIGVQQKGNARYLHLDLLKDGRPTIWSY